MSESRSRGFASLLTYIESELDFESGFYNDDYLDRRITARMRRVDADSYRQYRQLLVGDEDERLALLDSLSINVTGFFRNPEAWGGLRPILRELTAENRSVKIWSAPCADGREPYSLAMLALADDEVRADRISILGTDINGDILTAARRGTYETTRTSDIAAELDPLDEPDRYIDQRDQAFSVRDRVKDLVTFARHDLIRGDPKRDFDLVLCRNFLIYIDAEFKRAIFGTIHESLADSGYLMIGKTETVPGECRESFEPVSKDHRIYRRR